MKNKKQQKKECQEEQNEYRLKEEYVALSQKRKTISTGRNEGKDYSKKTWQNTGRQVVEEEVKYQCTGHAWGMIMKEDDTTTSESTMTNHTRKETNSIETKNVIQDEVAHRQDRQAEDHREEDRTKRSPRRTNVEGTEERRRRGGRGTWTEAHHLGCRQGIFRHGIQQCQHHYR